MIVISIGKVVKPMVKWLKSIFDKFKYTGGSQRGYFYRLIWIGCISACIPVILIGGLYYYIVTDSLQEQIESDTESSLILFKERVERILQTIEFESNQIATDPLIRDSFLKANFDSFLFDHLKILEQLKFRTLENSFIDEIFYYNMQNDFVLSNEYGYIRTHSFKYQKDIEKILNVEQNSTWINAPIATEEGYISFIRKLPAMNSGLPQGLLVMQVKMDFLQDYFPSQEYETSFILDPQDKVLFQDNEYTLDVHAENESALNMMLDNNSGTGKFYERDLHGEETLYVFDNTTSFGRTYFSFIPKHYIKDQMSWFRWMIFSSVFVFICVGVLLTIYNTRRVYNPIKQLMNYSKSLGDSEIGTEDKSEIKIISDCMKYLSLEKTKLGNYIEQTEPSLREWFFLQVLEGKYTIDEYFYRKCNDYDVPIDCNYVVMVINVANFNEKMTFYEKDKPILFFSLKNIILELAHNQPALDGIEINHSHQNLVAVLRFPKEMPSDNIRGSLHQLSVNINESVERYLSLNISTGIGRVYSSVKEVSLSYQEALSAIKYRIYKGSEAILFIEELEDSKKSGMFFYPRELESKILESLKVGDMNQAERSLNDFSTAISLFESYNKIYQCYHLLLSSILLSLEKQGNCISDIFEPDLFGQLKALQTTDEITFWFQDELFPLYQYLNNEAETSPGRSAVKLICQYINENISKDITLTQCAEMVNLTPSYLSRLFKKEVGGNFREYVLRRKVEEAKNLCIETDANVSEIAEAIGYSERNLTRLFQRYADMTLSQYRNKYR